MEFKDYYQTLGLGKTATAKDIKQAYRKLARKFHPDVNPGDKKAEARFKEINEAYEVLGDAEKRRKYDELGANWRMYEQAQQAGPSGQPFGGAPFGGGWNVDFGGAPGGYRTVSEEEMRKIFGDEDPFSDFFKTFFGGMGGGERAQPGRRGGRGGRPRGGRDVEREIELSLDEAFHGARRRLSIARDGSATRTVDVRIPPGVDEGSRVRIAGEGEPSPNGKAGDLYLRVRLRPDAHLERRGRDLYTRVAIPVTTAVLGGEVHVPAVGGTQLRLKVPEGTQNGQVFRLKGQGMPAVGSTSERGDLYATVDVQIPRSLTPEQREHYEALRNGEGRP